MKQNYHMNANTNSHSRAIIHRAKASNTTLAHRFGVSTKTIAKQKSRDFVKDKTSRPKTIHYALNETEREIIRVVRTLTWLELDDLTDSIVACMPLYEQHGLHNNLDPVVMNPPGSVNILYIFQQRLLQALVACSRIQPRKVTIEKKDEINEYKKKK